MGLIKRMKKARGERQEARKKRRATRLAGRQERTQGRQDRKTLRKKTVQLGRVAKAKKKAMKKFEKEPGEALNVLEDAQNIERLKKYVENVGEEPSDDLEELAQQADYLRGEQLEDTANDLYNEAIDEGYEPEQAQEMVNNPDFVEEMQFYDDSFVESPNEFDPFDYFITPEVWSAVGTMANKGIDLLREDRFKKGKKFLGKTEAEYKAQQAGRGKGGVGKQIIDAGVKDIEESKTKQFLKDNAVLIVLAVLLLIGLGFYFARSKK